MWRKIILFQTLLVAISFSQTYIVPDIQRDDFAGSTLKSWWTNTITPSSGSNHQLSILNGYMKADLMNPLNGGTGGRLDATGDGMENIGIATANNRPIYSKNMLMEAVVRVKTLNTLPVGSRGWGFWKSEKVPIVYNQAVWFFEQTAHPDSSWAASETYWRALTMDGIDPAYRFGTDVSANNQLWHTYKIRRYSGSTVDGFYEHYVDGVLVQRKVPANFPDGTIINDDYSFHAWNDNLVYHYTTNAVSGNDTVEVFYNGWIDTSSFVVDFIEIRKDGYDPSYQITPTVSDDFLRLRSYESEIDDGLSDGLWKSYSFDTNVGNTFVIVTAKAESYDGYDGDDDLKIIIDGSDYGYDNVNSWNGDVDDGLPKTLVFTPSLSSGSHTIELYSQTTPILYDVNVLSAQEGTLVLDQTLNETAPSGSSNYLWKELTFSCDAGPVGIYVSASADEEPGWNHQNAYIDSTDDDELRIELDNTNFGWGGDYGFVGNTLFGDVKTVLIKDTLTGGSHTLKLYANETPTVYRVMVFAQNGDYSLPVSLSAFNVNLLSNSVRITWTTESEIDNLGFNIFRAESADSVLPSQDKFVQINKQLIPGQGNSSTYNHYSFEDVFAPQKEYVWYRLQSVNLDGSRQFHKPVAVRIGDSLIPRETQWFPNYPNPFNPVTNIRFKIAEQEYVRITIYDLHGRRIRNLWQGEVKPGYHRFQWDGRDEQGVIKSAGIYFYQIKTSRYQHTGKMTLLK
ncbi:MAG: T9SS type A sorting domain-containing protein [Calditrichaeota bacterium]|nr:T9SS type A sorting domain-containing protein [Calditrichota bacterium]